MNTIAMASKLLFPTKFFPPSLDWGDESHSEVKYFSLDGLS